MKTDPQTWLQNYGDALYRYALMKTRDMSTAEDLVQETLLAGLKGHHHFKGGSSEQTWLIGILKHKISDHFRHTSREQLVENISAAQDETAYFDQRGHWQIDLQPWHDPHQAMEDEHFWQVFTACLERLPAQQADLFMLNEYHELSSAELCKLLDISTTNNLWVMLSRIRLRLRQCLDRNWFNSDRKLDH